MITVAWHIAVGLLAAIGALDVAGRGWRAIDTWHVNRALMGDPDPAVRAALNDALRPPRRRRRRPAPVIPIDRSKENPSHDH